jgi:hypothetical protein
VIGKRAHAPERNAALYVSGEMRERERRRFESHLLGCDDCWTEVSLGRMGRGLVEASREFAPPGLRDDVRAVISLTPGGRHLPRPLVFVAAAMVLTLSLFIVAEVRARSEPAPISSALAAARTETLPALGPSKRPAENLSGQGLRLVMSERVNLAGLVADASMYRNRAGEAVVLFVSDSPFPVARGAAPRPAGDDGWQAHAEGMTLVCGDHPLNYLVVAENPSLVGPVEKAVTTPQGT